MKNSAQNAIEANLSIVQENNATLIGHICEGAILLRLRMDESPIFDESKQRHTFDSNAAKRSDISLQQSKMEGI